MNRFTVIALACAVGAFLTYPSYAATPDVRTVVKEMKDVFEPARPSVRKLAISTTDHRGERDQWVVVQANKTFPEGKKMVMVTREPAALKGFALMIWEKKDGTTPIFLYLPALRRTLEETGMRAYDSFYGTEFTYADLGFIPVHEGYKLLGEEQYQGVRAYKVEETIPKERAYYSRVVTWIAADTKLPLERDYYDLAARLWKKELFSDVAVVDGVLTPMKVVMMDVQGGGKTELKIETIAYDVKVPDEVFDLFHLNKAEETLDDTLWKLLGTKDSKGTKK